jgi:hypothetical protein
MPLWKQHLLVASCALFGGALCLVMMSIGKFFLWAPAETMGIALASACAGTFVSAFLMNQWIKAHEETARDVSPIGVVTLVARLFVWLIGLVLLGWILVEVFAHDK